MQDKTPLAHYSGVLSDAVHESAAVTGKTAHPIAPEFNLMTSAGGRGYVSWYFSNVMQRHDFGNYITKTLAADFACALASWLRDGKARVESQAAPDALIADARRLAYVGDQIRALEPKGSESDAYLKEAAHVFRACADRIAALAATPAAAPVVLPEPVATIYTMEALAPGGAVKYHAQVHKALPSGTKLFAEPDVRALLATGGQGQAEALDAERWREATRNLEITEIGVVVFDNDGDYQVVIGEAADSAIDAAIAIAAAKGNEQ